jgi:hypothetical protein
VTVTRPLDCSSARIFLSITSIPQMFSHPARTWVEVGNPCQAVAHTLPQEAKTTKKGHPQHGREFDHRPLGGRRSRVAGHRDFAEPWPRRMQARLAIMAAAIRRLPSAPRLRLSDRSQMAVPRLAWSSQRLPAVPCGTQQRAEHPCAPAAPVGLGIDRRPDGVVGVRAAQHRAKSIEVVRCHHANARGHAADPSVVLGASRPSALQLGQPLRSQRSTVWPRGASRCRRPRAQRVSQCIDADIPGATHLLQMASPAAVAAAVGDFSAEERSDPSA